jgi:hypothetical protein
MSDLAATNCGCDNSNSCSSIIWILLLLSCCGNGGTSLFNGNGNGCDSIWIILLILCCCGNGNGCGSNGGCF